MEPTLTPLQKQVLHLLGIPEQVYRRPDAGQYYSYGTVSKTYRVIDQYVADRFRRFLT